MFWIPKYKKELSGWLNNFYHCKKFSYLSKKQLYAVYFKVRMRILKSEDMYV